MFMSPENLSGLPPIWTPEWGMLWENLFNYVVFLGFTGGHIRDSITTFFVFVKAQVNKIQFSIPLPGGKSIRIDFSKYAWDDKFFDDLKGLVMLKVDAKEKEAKKIKLKHQKALKAATTEEDREKVMDEYEKELDGLADAALADVKTFNPQLFKATITRFGKDRAEEYIRNTIHASVVQRKNGTAERVSMTATIKNLDAPMKEAA